MTQVVRPDTLAVEIENVALSHRGRAVTFSRDGSRYFAEMIDPDWEAEQRKEAIPVSVATAPRVRRQIVMSTGSHHFQTFWINGRHAGELWQTPWVFHLPTQQWMPAEQAFVAPPDAPPRLTLWNDNCIQCHVTAGRPGRAADSHYDSAVADFGIACESCHGPGRRHVALRQADAAGASESPRAGAGDIEQAIVNPARIDPRKSAQVCGQCHSYFSFNDREFFVSGFKYRAGDDLDATRYVHDFDDDYVQGRPDLLQGYWRDGTMRIAGREFSAMDDSACYQSGQLSCVSCHSMHQYESQDDQLGRNMRSDQACAQCHAEQARQGAEHTHHAPDSSGARCYNCHMPHSSFGLLKAMRSHRIDSPTAAMTAKHGRPNACNLCHVDQTLQWTAEQLRDWYGQPSPELSPDDQKFSTIAMMLFRGDAVQRAVAAAALGSANARTTNQDWQPALLTLSLGDSYAAVRFAAHQSLTRFSGYESAEFEFLGEPKSRNIAMARVAQAYAARPAAGDPERNTRVLLTPGGLLQVGEVRRLMGQQDQRRVWLPE